MLREQITAGWGGWRAVPKVWRTVFGVGDRESRDVKDEFYSGLMVSFSQIPPTPSTTGKQLYMLHDAQCSS